MEASYAGGLPNDMRPLAERKMIMASEALYRLGLGNPLVVALFGAAVTQDLSFGSQPQEPPSSQPPSLPRKRRKVALPPRGKADVAESSILSPTAALDEA